MIASTLWRAMLFIGDTRPMSPTHEPVMVEEVLAVLPLEPGSTVVDGTLGLAGHSLKIIEQIRPGGKLVGFDWDAAMLAIARERLSQANEVSIELHQDDFRSIPDVVAVGSVDAILLDLGLNSAQVDDPSRGFSFKSDSPLDARMDKMRGEPASAVLNRLSLGEIEQMLWDLGDERWARAIARQIVERRRTKPLLRTGDLVECVLAAIPPGAREKRINPSTRTFQAVRIYVNRELEGLCEGLSEIAGCLKSGGVFAVLSYHSGEDRIVKTAFRELSRQGYEELLKKPRIASAEEVARNPRSRSAKLRAVRRS